MSLAVKDHSEVPRAGPSPELVLQRDGQESWGESAARLEAWSHHEEASGSGSAEEISIND